jgi:hypothetical protein
MTSTIGKTPIVEIEAKKRTIRNFRIVAKKTRPPMTQKTAHHFTVSQLIEILQSFPQDLPVLTSGYENGFENIQPPEETTVTHEPEKPFYDGEFQTISKPTERNFNVVVLRRVVRN